MVKIWVYFYKSIWIAIFVFLKKFFVPKAYVFESFRWGIIPLDCVGFPFRTSKLKNDINYIKCKFSHRFGKVCRWLNMYYSKIRIITFRKVIIMFIWIILKNLLWTNRKCNFCQYWIIVACIYLIAFVIAFGEIFLSNILRIFLKKFSKKFVNFFSYYVHVKNLAKNVIFKKIEIH